MEQDVQKAQEEGSYWTENSGIYRNRETGRLYKPHHDEEARFVYSDTPTNAAVIGSEGSGKSVAGIVKDLERLRRGMSGILVSPDLPHFKRSLWAEFQRWCPWQEVVEQHQYRKSFSWEPHEPFLLAFKNGATLLCGGIEDPIAWEGPNVSFAHMDEARRARSAAAVKVLKGRVRIPGPRGEPAQLYVTTTPKTNWLFEFFGPIQYNDEGDVEDEQIDFKRDSITVKLHVRDNLDNLDPGFLEKRAQGLTESEKRVVIDAEWEDTDNPERFLPSISMWDACKEDFAAVDDLLPMVLGLDAGVSNDCFGLIGVTRHPLRKRDCVRVALTRLWEPKGRALDFDKIEEEIIGIILDKAHFNVLLVTYDVYQIHQMMGKIRKICWARRFSQGTDRAVADKRLLDLITTRKISHDGNLLLRRHLDNADRKSDDNEAKLRLVKRSKLQKIDLAVALSMASTECLKLNIGH